MFAVYLFDILGNATCSFGFVFACHLVVCLIWFGVLLFGVLF